MESPDRIAEALEARWQASLREGERFEAEVGANADFSFARLVLVAPDGERFVFEVRQHGGAKPDVPLDAADALLGSWLEDDRPHLPGHAEALLFAGKEVEVRTERRRPDLEEQANRLLGVDSLDDEV